MNLNDRMTTMKLTTAKTKKSLLGLALGTLIATSLPGTAEASWSSPRCAVQCSKTIVGDSKSRLNNCVKNCPDNMKKLLDALKTEQSTKKDEQNDIETQLKSEKSRSRIKRLNSKQNKLMPEINKLGNKISVFEKALGISSRPTLSEMELSQKEKDLIAHVNSEGEKGQQSGANNNQESEPPSLSSSTRSRKALPTPPGNRASKQVESPPLSTEVGTEKAEEKHTDIPAPSDTPPNPEAAIKQAEKETAEREAKEATEKAAAQGTEGKPTPPPMKKAGGPPPPMLGQNPRTILKAEIEAQNPGKKEFEIKKLIQDELDKRYPGKNAGEINQLLKADQEARYSGKSPAEILESIKGGGAQPSSASPVAMPSKTTNAEEGANIPTPPTGMTPPKIQVPQGQPSTGDLMAEMLKKAQEKQNRLSQSGGTPQEQQKQYTLTEDDKKRLDRRISIDGEEEAKKDIEGSLQQAKKSQDTHSIAKYSAELAHVEEKIKAKEDEDWN